MKKLILAIVVLSTCSVNCNFQTTSPNTKDRADIRQIPFEFVRNQIMIKVHLKGQGPYNMFVDTGTVPSAISQQVAESLGFKVDTENPAQAFGTGTNTVYTYPSEITDLAINGTEYGDIEAVANSFFFEMIKNAMAIDLHGVLGVSFLKDKAITIDYQDKLLIIGHVPPDKDSGEFRFPFVEAKDDIMPVIEIEINGKKGIFTMDTGSSQGISIHDSSLSKFGLQDEVKTWEEQKAAGYRGAVQSVQGKIKDVTIGPFNLKDVAASTRSGREGTDGNVGNELFKNFRVTIDYVGKKIIMEKL